MKTLLSAVLLMAFGASPFVSAQDGKWFDMEHCGICKCMANHKDLMKEMTWEVHKIDKGLVTIATIPEKVKGQMEAVHKEMMAAVAKLEAGEPMELCGFCNSYGALKQAGAKFEEIETAGGNLTIITSDDPAVIAKIHAHADKSKAAHAELVKQLAH